MARAILTIEDTDIQTGQVKITIDVQDSMIDDGRLTASEVMVRVLHTEIHTPEFREKLWKTISDMTNGTAVEIANDDLAPQKAG